MEKSPKILVVDDEENILRNCSKIFTKAGYAVDTARNGREALVKIGHDDFDLVLTDLMMPELDGLQLLQEIVKFHPEISVVILTGFATVESAVEAMKIGAEDYIAKPFSSEELVSKIETVVKNKREKLSSGIPLESEEDGLENIIGKGSGMRGVFTLVRKAAPTNSNILIMGESGTGKELVARAIHNLSKRKDQKFVAVDSSMIPKELLESELFGYVKGAFTGANANKKGLFEIADGGTLFLDEIGDIRMEFQGKLLRVLQEREFRPVGGRKSIKIDIRFIFATNKDLKGMVSKGEFREDLFYRIYVFPVSIPPLRERREDIPLLVNHFIRKYSEEPYNRNNGPTVSEEVLKVFVNYEWPGNVRQLENIIQRMMVLEDSNILTSKHLPQEIHLGGEQERYPTPRTMDELKEIKKKIRLESAECIEREFVLNALRRNQWNVTKAARDVGMQRTNFHALMRKLNIRLRKGEELERDG